MSSSLVFIVVLTVYQANCAKIKFTPTIEHGNLNLDCSYELTKDEVLYKVLIKKDSETFVKFDDSNKDNPDFHKVPGIKDVKLNGGGKVTINNFGDDTWGIYNCVVLYDPKTPKNKNKSKKKAEKGSQNVSKKYKLRLDACTPKWVATSNGQIPPKTAMLARKANGAQLAFCRAKVNDALTPGVLNNQGCLITYSQKFEIATSNYEVLTGDGFIWEKHTGGNGNLPDDAYECGKDSQGTLFCGACNIQNDWFFGKIGNKLYYYNNDQELSDCNEHHILICAQ